MAWHQKNLKVGTLVNQICFQQFFSSCLNFKNLWKIGVLICLNFKQFIIKGMKPYGLNYNAKVDCLKFKQIKPPIF